MTPDRAADLDLPALAEDIAADRRTLSNVIDQIAAGEPDDAVRRQAVAELQSLVVALTAGRRLSSAMTELRRGGSSAPVAAHAPVPEPSRAMHRPRNSRRWRVSRPRLVTGAGAVLLVVVGVAVVTIALR